jgi:chromosome segregation ATPase
MRRHTLLAYGRIGMRQFILWALVGLLIAGCSGGSEEQRTQSAKMKERLESEREKIQTEADRKVTKANEEKEAVEKKNLALNLAVIRHEERIRAETKEAAKIKRLEGEIGELKEQERRQEIDELKLKLSNLRGENFEHRVEIIELKRRIARLEKKNEELADHNRQWETMYGMESRHVEKLEARNEKLRRELEQLKAKPTPKKKGKK